MNAETELEDILKEPGVLATVSLIDLLLPLLKIVPRDFADILMNSFTLPFLLIFISRIFAEIDIRKHFALFVGGSYTIFLFRSLQKIKNSLPEFYRVSYNYFIALLIFTMIGLLYYLINKLLLKVIEKRRKLRLTISMMSTTFFSTIILKTIKSLGLLL